MRAYALFHQYSQFLLDLLYPPKCVHCQSTAGWLCPDCLNKITYIAPPVCQRCGMPVVAGAPRCQQCHNNPLRAIDGIRSASYFEDNPMRPAIHLLKYRHHQAVASVLGQILVDTLRHYDFEPDVVMPVPLHTSRLKERGYNQSELVAKPVAAWFNIVVDTHTLQRVRKTKTQMELNLKERHQNVLDAFACKDKLSGQKVLLIDDVCTTGSTLDACAAALKQDGAAAIWGLTLARARLKN